MFKRYALAFLVAGLALGAQSAVAGRDDSPFPYAATERQSPPWADFLPDNQPAATVIPASAPRQVVNPQTAASPRATMPAPYDTPGGYFN
jgi:hypothetical protein